MIGIQTFTCTLAGLCLWLNFSGLQALADDLYLSYTENETELFRQAFAPVGCYAHLEAFPHWCLGNLSRCHGGFTLSTWIKSHGDLTPERASDVLLTSGGWNSNSDGFYIVRKYSDQYTVGVAFLEKVWQTGLRLRGGSWMLIGLSWDMSKGLSVFVDGLMLEWVKTPEIRRINANLDGSANSLAMGLTEMGEPVTSTCSYVVGETRVVNAYNMSQTLVDNNSIIQNLYLGCTTSSVLEHYTLDSKASQSPGIACRNLCYQDKRLYALVLGAMSCVCEDVISNLDSTDCVGKWHVYLVSHVRTTHNYQLRLKYLPQSKNAYTKPREDILFFAGLNYRLDVVYRFAFDDGVVISTTDSRVTHSWMSAGRHSVTVQTRVGLVQLTNSLNLTVEDVDEGQVPDLVGLTVGHNSQLPLTGHYSIMVVDEHRTECKLSFGDGQISPLYSFLEFGSRKEVQHEFKVCGCYRAESQCSNAYGNTSADLRFLARELTTTYHYISSFQNFSIATVGDVTFFSTLLVKINNSNVDFTPTRKSSVLIDSSHLSAGAENTITVESDQLVLDRHVVSVRRPVKTPVIAADKTSGAWSLSPRFIFTLEPSDHTWMTIHFGNGGAAKVLYIPEAKTSLPIADTADYKDLGDYTVTVKVYNEISEASNSLDISVEVPIRSLSVSTRNITSLRANATFIHNINGGIRGPQKVVFYIVYGDGSSESVFYRNKLSSGFEPFIIEHMYKRWGIYKVKVVASNNISQEVEDTLIQIGENMTFLDILTKQERIMAGGILEFTINCPNGSDVLYTVDFGDGTNFTVGELSGPENSAHSSANLLAEDRIVVSHVYSKPGYYSVRVTAVNAFGVMYARLCPQIAVAEISRSDCPLPSVFFKNMNTSIDNPLVRKRSVDTLITVEVGFECSHHNSSGITVMTYSWKGVSLERSKTGGPVEKSIYTYCEFKSADNILMVQALHLPFGIYKLTVTVSPSNNDLTYSSQDFYINVIQSEPTAIIDGDAVRIIMLYATAIFDISKSYDPDLRENRRKDLSFYIFFMPEASLKEAKKWSLETLERKSNLLTNKTIFPSTTANSFDLYQYGTCFNDTSSLKEDLSTFTGKVTFAANNFVANQFSFGIILWVERNNLTSSASQIVEIRSSNMSLDDIGSLLDLALNADPDTAIRLCGGAASAILNQDASSAEEQAKLAESTEAVVKTLGAVASRIDSPNQATKCASAIKTMTSNKDIVSEGSRSSAAGAFKSLANGTSAMVEATVDDTANFAGECLGGLGNIFPRSPEKIQTPKRTPTDPASTTTEILGLVATRLANTSSTLGYTTPFTTLLSKLNATTQPTTPPSPPTATATTTRTTKLTIPTTAATTSTTSKVITTSATTTVIHTTVGTTLSPAVGASFVDNGDNYTISGVTVATLQLNASKDYSTSVFEANATTTASPTTSTLPTVAPVTIPIDPRMFEPRSDPRSAYDIVQEILNKLPDAKTYDELMEYIFGDCFLFRMVMKSPEIQSNCPCISSEAINLMKCEGDFSLQDRVFDIMTRSEHPDDLYEGYIVPLDKARKARDIARKATDKEVANTGLGALGTVAESVGAKTSAHDRAERTFETPRLKMKLAKAGLNNGTNSTEGTGGKQKMQMSVGGFDMPADVLMGAAAGCSNINTMFMGDSDNPYTYGEKDTNVGRGVLSLDYTCNGEKIVVQHSQEPIVLWMDRDVNAYQPGLFVLLTNTKTDVRTNVNYHPVNISERNVSLQVVLEPRDSTSAYYVYIKYGERPNTTHYDFMSSTPNKDASLIEGYHDLNDLQKEQLRYTVVVPQTLTTENGTYWIGIKFKSGNIEIDDTTANTSYTLLMLLSGCRYWDEMNDTWSSEGCQVGPFTTKYRTHCICYHLTSFGTDAAIPPNTIDFSNVWAKFNNLNENAAVFSTVIVLVGLYVILLVWLRHMDKKDLVKWGAMPLEDNLPTDRYHYQVTVQTGIKADAQTDSQVRFIVSGEEADSGVRRLAVADGQRKHLPRGSILNYVMSVDSCLGPLTFLRIWHDNSGKGRNKSWYLDQVQICDLQTGEKFIFLCGRWLAVEEDDGMIDRIFPVAGIDDLIAFKQLFSSSARKKLANDHLWLSVFSRPTRSNFTRVQRLSCCMSLLFLTMITNAMWFKTDTQDQKVEAIKLGPFSFTLSQLFISFASTIIVFPPNFLMITFFRRCRPNDNTIGHVNQPVVKDKQKFRWKKVTSTSLGWGPRTKKSRMRKLQESISKILTFHKKNKYVDSMSQEDDDATMVRKKKKTPWTLPHWCLYIAWVVCFLSVVVSGFFTILYSMQWGREKANEWLTTFLLSFFQSVIVIQPLKVLLLVAFIACVLKKPDLEDDDIDVTINEVLVGGRDAANNRDEASLSQIMLQRRCDSSEIQPPDLELLAQARQTRIMEIKMEAVLKEIVVYTLFLIIIFFLSYQQRDPQSYNLASNIRNRMLSGHDEIKTSLDWWVWLDETLLPSLYALQYANEEGVKNWQDAACISDMESRRVGVARIRQLRVKNDTCTIVSLLKPLINHCRDKYSWMDDDTKPYLPFWVTPPEDMVKELEDSTNPFVYQGSFKLKNAPYVGTLATYKGGGYVILAKRLHCRTKAVLDIARSQNWLDLNTKAIFIEYTVYNPNVNLFASVTAVTEFLTTGSATSRTDVKVFRLMSYIGGFGVLVLVFEILFGIFTLYFFVECIKKVKKQRMLYFKDFWTVLEFVLLCFAIACIALYSFKHVLTEIAMKAIRDRKSDGYVNFNAIALYDEMYGYIIAMVVFMATVQFLKLLQFNRKMGMLGSTIKLASKDLKMFTITFLLYFGAFTTAAFLLFGQVLVTYQNVITAAESMFAFALGSFDYGEITTAQPILGPIFIFSYIGVVYIGLMSIFLTIIGDSFSQVKENIALQNNDYEVMEFMWKKIKTLFG